MQVSVKKPGSPEDLVHFGAKGMKWGIRKDRTSNGKAQPKKISERKEKRAKGHDAIVHNTQKEIDRIKANPSKWRLVQAGRNNQIKELEKHRDTHSKAAKDIRDGHLTTFQKRALIGAGVAATIVATYGTYKVIDSGAAHQILSRNTILKENDLLTRHMSSESILREVVAPINPNYGGVGTKMNCRRATFAYEMRRRGLDVKATNSAGGTGQTVAGILNATNPNSHLSTGRVGMFKEGLKEAYSKSETGPLTKAMKTAHGMGTHSVDDLISKTPSAKTALIFEALGKHPEGARGELGLLWHRGGAHSMAWEIIGGKPHIFDAQTGVAHSFESFREGVAESVNRAGFTRLDHVDLNEHFLRRWVRNVK